MKLEVYFDYLCPFCERAWRSFKELLPQYHHIETVFRPCEASPRRETPYGVHSDLAISGMFFVQEHGGDVMLYNDNLFQAVFQKREDIEDIELLAHYVQLSGGDADEFKAAMKNRSYEQMVLDANDYAYEKKGVYAIPVFALENGRRIDAVLGIGVTKEALRELLEGSK